METILLLSQIATSSVSFFCFRRICLCAITGTFMTKASGLVQPQCLTSEFTGARIPNCGWECDGESTFMPCAAQMQRKKI